MTRVNLATRILQHEDSPLISLNDKVVFVNLGSFGRPRGDSFYMSAFVTPEFYQEMIDYAQRYKDLRGMHQNMDVATHLALTEHDFVSRFKQDSYLISEDNAIKIARHPGEIDIPMFPYELQEDTVSGHLPIRSPEPLPYEGKVFRLAHF